MTSPSVDLDGIMPYGVTVVGDGTSRMAKVATPAKQATNERLSLPGGPVRVSASWSGSEAVRLTLAGVGYPVNIPAGGGGSVLGRRSSARRVATMSIWNRPTTRHYPRGLAALSRCTHSHSSNRRGGGVGDLPCERSGNHHLLDSVQRDRSGVSGLRKLFTAVYRRAIHHGFGAWWNRLCASIDHRWVQNAVSKREYGGWANSSSAERGPARRNNPLPVVLLQHRRRGLLRNNPEVLTTAGVV